MKTTPVQPANARVLGNAVRKTLKTLGLEWRVKAATTSFAGFGYGSCPFASIETTRLLTREESGALARTLREVRALPPGDGGGKGIIQLCGANYAMGGSIGYMDHPEAVSRTGKQQRFLDEYTRRTGIDFFTDAGMGECDLERWTDNLTDCAEDAKDAVTTLISKYGLEDLAP